MTAKERPTALKIARVYVNDRFFIVGNRLSLKNHHEKNVVSAINETLDLKWEINEILKKCRVARISASSINPCESALILATPSTPILGINMRLRTMFMAQPDATI